MAKPRTSLAGRRFGNLLVMEWIEDRSNRKSIWLCLCDCGNYAVKWCSQLRSKTFHGCNACVNKYKSEFQIVHGDSLRGKQTELYRIWQAMRTRCRNPAVENYKYYGGKGVTVCVEWDSSFVAFREWAMTHGYHRGLTIERKDSTGNYEPGNCEWITQSENSKRRHANRKLKLVGQYQSGKSTLGAG